MNMRNIMISSTLVTGLMAASLTPAYADLSPGQNDYYSSVLQKIYGALHDIDGVVKNTSSYVLRAMTEQASNVSTTQVTRQNMDTLQQNESDYAQGVQNTLTTQYQGANTVADNINRAYALDQQSFGNYSNLSAYSLLGLSKTNNLYSVTYNNDQQKAANQYAAFLAGDALPLMKPQGDDSSLKTRAALNGYRTMAAIQSLDAYNVSKYLASRTGIVSTNKPGLKDIPTPNGQISRLGLNRYLLMKKANDPNWYNTLQTESPYAVMRDGVSLLGASLSELYQIEQNQEQMILTQTATNTATLAMIKKLNDMMAKANSQMPTNS